MSAPEDERVARERLGAWLAAEPGRVWDCDGPSSESAPVYGVQLSERFGGRAFGWNDGTTLADAILAALGKAQP